MAQAIAALDGEKTFGGDGDLSWVGGGPDRFPPEIRLPASRDAAEGCGEALC